MRKIIQNSIVPLMFMSAALIVIGMAFILPEKPNAQMSEWNVNYTIKAHCITFDKAAEIEKVIREAIRGLDIDIEIEKYNAD